MIENWYALYISALTQNSIDKSLTQMGIGQKRTIKKLYLTKHDAEVLKKMRKAKIKWDELAEEFEISGDALRNRVYKLLKADMPRRQFKNKIAR